MILNKASRKGWPGKASKDSFLLVSSVQYVEEVPIIHYHFASTAQNGSESWGCLQTMVKTLRVQAQPV